MSRCSRLRIALFLLVVLPGAVLFFSSLFNWVLPRGSTQNKENGCALIETIYEEDSARLALMLEGGCDPAVGEFVNEPMYVAIYLGNVDVVRLLLEHGVDPKFDWGERGGNLLTHSAQFGHLEIVKLLIENGADVRRADGHTALYRTIIYGHDEVRNYLESQGAVLNPNDKKALELLGISTGPLH